MLTNHFPQDQIQQTHFSQHAMFEPKIEENEEEEAAAAEREVMFEKPLTPSDVGKLNRLVIPKQHAEKHFPLASGGGDSGDKGLVLSFEDESGKLWRFRYSYWNSSQSYVLTKGWSRFVKEKKLESGDRVLFHRCRYVPDRLYIGWKRRTPSQDSSGGHVGVTAVPLSRVLYSAYPTHPSSAGLLYVGDQNQHADAGEALVGKLATPSNSKRVRLFGVNLDSPPDPRFMFRDTIYGVEEEIAGHVPQIPPGPK